MESYHVQACAEVTGLLGHDPAYEGIGHKKTLILVERGSLFVPRTRIELARPKTVTRPST